MSWLYPLLPWQSDYFLDSMLAFDPRKSPTSLFDNADWLLSLMDNERWVDGHGLSTMQETCAVAAKVTCCVADLVHDNNGLTFNGMMATQLGLADRSGRLRFPLAVPGSLVRCVRTLRGAAGVVASHVCRFAPALIFAACLGLAYYATSRKEYRSIRTRNDDTQDAHKEPLTVSTESSDSSPINNKAEPEKLETVMDLEVPCIATPETSQVLHAHRPISPHLTAFFTFSLWDALALLHDTLTGFTTRLAQLIRGKQPALRHSTMAATCARDTHGALWHIAVDGQHEIRSHTQGLLPIESFAF